MGTKIIACDVMKEELLSIPAANATDYEFLPMGLHDQPDKLHSELQRALDGSPGYDRIILGFGLCGNATRDLEAKHCEMVIPRVHECIPLLLGCNETYEKIKAEGIGVYFLTGGWTEGEQGLLNEYQRCCNKYGNKEAAEIFEMMFKNYSRLFFINTCHPRLGKAREYARKVAGIFSLNYQEAEGSKGYLTRLVNGPWNENEFITVKQGCRFKFTIPV